MASHSEVPFRAQDPHEIGVMVRDLNDHKGKGKGSRGFSCKKATFAVDGSDLSVDSWRLADWDYKKPNLPTYARGLFTTTTRKGKPEIAVRGYDKFFNHGEVRETEWQNVERDTRGPYELSVKENGCIIFVAGMEDGTLIVCSKHSTGERGDINVSHANAGDQWVDKQLASVGKSRADLARTLREMNATAVAELCDDDFEEHVLEYGADNAGLYLHGINLNLPEFATYPHPLVDQFAEQWGFKKTQYVTKDTIQEVKTFLDGIGETGHYNGRDTEGFVIRCQSKAITREWHDWFFKYKFEEPYLMYRQWRECTKAVISGKPPRYKKHKRITEEYIEFARRELHRNPARGKAYMQNHGIIKLRDDFLAFRGIDGHDIIRLEGEAGEVGSEAVTREVVLVPVATIGCGKTTIALALCKLFGWGHVQNDNITVKKGKPAVFAQTCARELEQSPAMIADRNNHQRREREQLIKDMSKIVPHARFVALNFVHDRATFNDIRAKLRERVLSRGDNHQTINSSTKGQDEIVHIMEGFMGRFEPVDRTSSPDDGFDLTVDLNPVVDSRENLETVINALYAEYPKLFAEQEMPSSEDMDAAIHAAMNNYTVDIRHEIQGRDDKRSKGVKATRASANGAADKQQQKERKVEYFGVQVPATQVNAILDGVFQGVEPLVAKVYNSLKQQRRIQPEFHVTLIHRASAGQHQDVWNQLADLYAKESAPTPERNYVLPEAKLGLCKVRLERLVWDQRLMAFVVRLNPFDENSVHFRSVNATAHITVGTMSADIKPKESNDLLAKWMGAGSGNGIQELAINGNVELEGTVRAVLAR